MWLLITGQHTSAATHPAPAPHFQAGNEGRKEHLTGFSVNRLVPPSANPDEMFCQFGAPHHNCCEESSCRSWLERTETHSTSKYIYKMKQLSVLVLVVCLFGWFFLKKKKNFFLIIIILSCWMQTFIIPAYPLQIVLTFFGLPVFNQESVMFVTAAPYGKNFTIMLVGHVAEFSPFSNSLSIPCRGKES